MIRIVDANIENPFVALRGRAAHRDVSTEQVVAEIIEDVRTRGDEALLESARRFDAPTLNHVVHNDSLQPNSAELAPARKQAIDVAVERVTVFHQAQLSALTAGWTRRGAGWFWNLLEEGMLGQAMFPLRRVGVYVPGGKANYPSSVVMNAVPAKVAGVVEVIVATPARPDGNLSEEVLYATDVVGLSQIVKCGGAAAIAAMALGTETVPRVDKIVGPGNRFVNEAKRQLWGTVGLDGYAGPSEVCVLADDAANARWAAADLLTQIEHAEDNAAFLVTVSRAKLDDILAEVEAQLTGAPRESTMRAALAADSLAFVARDMDEACDIVNAIAPEHLTICTEGPEFVHEKIHNAGCVLMGEWTPESAGDFCMGPSHTLPTSGAARFGSPVNILDFLKVQSLAQLGRRDLEELLPVIEAFGAMEGFPTHARGASIRFESRE